MNTITPQEALAKIDSLSFSRHAPVNETHKVAILATKYGMKPAFMGDYQENLEDYKEAGRRLGLTTRLTNMPPTDRYHGGKPNVPQLFLQRFKGIDTKQRSVVWLVSNVVFLPEITAAAKGSTGEGNLLGYPNCCIADFERDRTRLVEELYAYLVERYETHDEKKLAEILLSDPGTPMLRTIRESRVLDTLKAFPFVSHIACRNCLSGHSAESKSLNLKFRELAEEAGLRLRVEQTVSAAARRIDLANRTSF